jgi:hypothetical protein
MVLFSNQLDCKANPCIWWKEKNLVNFLIRNLDYEQSEIALYAEELISDSIYFY